jgi:hypothetical protein
MVVATLNGLDLAAVAAAVAAAVGVVLVGRGLWQYRRLAAVVDRAEETTGTVEQATIRPVHGGGSRSFIPAVTYTYQTPTERRTGETVYPGNSRFVKRFGTESAARNAVEPYDPESQTTVYYDPREPTHSFLEPAVQTGPQITQLGVGLICLAVAVLLGIVI